MKYTGSILFSLIVMSLGWFACNPSSDIQNPGVYKLSYGDSIIYLRTTSNGADYIVNPTAQRAGTYSAFPDGIQIDELTGAINVTKSETGLRYKIMFVPTGSTDTISTKIVLSGINFYDKIYHLSQGDTIAYPIYNANGQPYAPGLFGTGTNNSFDDDHGCNNQGCAVSLINGSINLAQSIRNGAIPSSNDAQKEFTYYYKLDDPSQKTLNQLKVKLYYYNTYADIPQYLWDIILIDHAGTILRTASTQRIAKPRPPCVIVVGQ